MNMLDNMIKYNEEKEEEATEVKNKEENKEKKEKISFNNNLPGINDIITNNNQNNYNNKENNIDENNNVDNIKEDNTKEHNIDNDNIYNYNNQNIIYHDNNINYNFNSNENYNNNNNIYGTNLNSNINNINYNNVNTMNMNNYMNNNLNNNQNIENDIPQEKGGEKDIIDELIEKIRTNQQITNRESSKESLNKLDEEIKLGLERLNQLFPSQKNCFDTKDKDNNKYRINKIKVQNRKFTDLLHEINKTLNETNNKNYYNKRNNYYDYKNVKIIKPRVYFQSESRQPIYDKNLNYRNNLYMSSIDGKLIVNGQRKNLFDSSNLENIYKNTGNNFYRMKTSLDFNTDRNFNNLNRRRNYSIDKLSSNFRYKKRNPSFNIRSANRFNKDYFMDELNKIQNLLFSDIRRSNKYY